MKKFLEATIIIDYLDAGIQDTAQSLAKNCLSDEAVAKSCFEFVRDENSLNEKFEFLKLLHEPLKAVMNNLKANTSYEKMINNFPDI